jgi:hypothetical protein
MLETVVIGFAAAVGVGLLVLMFYALHQQDLNLQRRVDAAASGGRPLSRDESADAVTRGIRPTSAAHESGGKYRRYRGRNALTRTQLVLGAAVLGYVVAFAVAVDRLGLLLGMITMYVLGMVAVGLGVLWKRRWFRRVSSDRTAER